MADIAAEAHVSVKTVSRVVNHEPGVRPDTAERVRAVIERVGFRRGDSAATLRQGRTFTIGLVVEDLADPFYSQIGAAVEREARIHRYLLVTASAEGSPTRERSVLKGLVARRVDGLIVVPAGETPVADPTVIASRTPVVYLDRPVRSETPVDTVLSDNLGGIRSAVEHLVAHGHRRIGFLGDSADVWTARQRREGFMTTHRDLRLPGTPLVSMGPHSPETVRSALTRWTGGADPVTAIITGNTRVTIPALTALHDWATQLSFVAYDDFELSDVVEPPVTVVFQDPAAMGQKAAQQLFARLLGDEGSAQTFVLPTRLVVRSSGVPRRPGRDVRNVSAS
jgi:LacI family transcriptional regulator